MNPSRVKMLAEHDGHYEMHDGQSSFRVPKNGLSEAMHGKIRALSAKDAGDAKAYQEGVDAAKAPQGLPGGMSESDWNRARGKQYGEQVDESNQARWGASQNMADGGVADAGTSDGGYGSAYRPMPAAPPPEAMKFTPNPEGGYSSAPDAGQSFVAPSGEAGMPVVQGAPSITQDQPDYWKPKHDYNYDKTETAPKPEGERKIVARQPPPTREEPKAAPAKKPAAGVTHEASPELNDSLKALRERAVFEEAKQGAIADIQQSAIEQADVRERENRLQAAAAHQQGQSLIDRHMAAVDDMANINTTVDPNRYWASRSTPQKILAIVGMALGGINGGPNRAVDMIQQSIDRDIEAQKSEHQIRLARGKAQAEGYQTDYSMAHSLAGDDLATNELARSSGNARAKALVDQMATKFGGYQVHPEMQIVANELAQKQSQAAANAAHIRSETALNNARAKKLGEAAVVKGQDTADSERAVDEYFNAVDKNPTGLKEHEIKRMEARNTIARDTNLSPRLTKDLDAMFPGVGRWNLQSKEEKEAIKNSIKKYIRRNAGKPGTSSHADDLDIEE